jgi:hypothetical protein
MTISSYRTVDDLRQIVNRRTAGKVDGQMVDLFSASAILSIYDALSEENQAKYRAMPIRRMAAVAFALREKVRA